MEQQNTINLRSDNRSWGWGGGRVTQQIKWKFRNPSSRLYYMGRSFRPLKQLWFQRLDHEMDAQWFRKATVSGEIRKTLGTKGGVSTRSIEKWLEAFLEVISLLKRYQGWSVARKTGRSAILSFTCKAKSRERRWRETAVRLRLEVSQCDRLWGLVVRVPGYRTEM
jgi:hypothetical protein